jgi:hypothetical protein
MSEGSEGGDAHPKEEIRLRERQEALLTNHHDEARTYIYDILQLVGIATDYPLFLFCRLYCDRISHSVKSNNLHRWIPMMHLLIWSP